MLKHLAISWFLFAVSVTVVLLAVFVDPWWLTPWAIAVTFAIFGGIRATIEELRS